MGQQECLQESIEEKKRAIQRRLVSSEHSLDLLKLRPTLRKKIVPLSKYMCNKFFSDPGCIELILKLAEFDPMILITFMGLNKQFKQAI